MEIEEAEQLALEILQEQVLVQGDDTMSAYEVESCRLGILIKKIADWISAHP